MYEEFLMRQIKAPYQDGDSIKVARGLLVGIDDNFIQVKGKKGTILVNVRNVHKICIADEEV